MRNRIRGKSSRSTTETLNNAKHQAWSKPVLALLLIGVFPGAILAGNVVVNGEEAHFYADDIINTLTVKNGGRALLHPGTTIQENIRIEGEGSYANFESDVWVGGNVTVTDGGSLSMWWSTIAGNLHGDGFNYVNFLISEVGGNIQMNDGGTFNGAFGPSVVGRNIHINNCSGDVLLNWFRVGENVQISKCEGGFWGYIEVRNCEIDGKLHVFKNDMNDQITIADNLIGGNLIVKDNWPTAAVSGNDVEGKMDLD